MWPSCPCYPEGVHQSGHQKHVADTRQAKHCGHVCRRAGPVGSVSAWRSVPAWQIHSAAPVRLPQKTNVVQTRKKVHSVRDTEIGPAAQERLTAIP